MYSDHEWLWLLECQASDVDLQASQRSWRISEGITDEEGDLDYEWVCRQHRQALSRAPIDVVLRFASTRVQPRQK